MSNWSRKWFYALTACAAASLTVGAGAATAASLPGIAIKAPLVEKDVLAVGYRGRPDYYANDYYANLSEYYSYYWPSKPNARRHRNYDYDNSYDYSDSYPDSYDYSNHDIYNYEGWPSYTSGPDRYYGTRAPVEAYERDDYYVWLPPSQPRSCGEYHYWTGSSCVDARHFKPYVGPKW